MHLSFAPRFPEELTAERFFRPGLDLIRRMSQELLNRPGGNSKTWELKMKSLYSFVVES